MSGVQHNARSTGGEAGLAVDWAENGEPGGREQPLLGRAEVADLVRGGGKRPPGLLAALRRDAVAAERLPVLEAVVDRFRRLASESLRGLVGGHVEIDPPRFDRLRLGAFLEGLPPPSLIALFRATEWGGVALLVVDRPLAHGLVDLLLGGRRAGSASPFDERPYTAIEIALVERLIRTALDDLARAFEPVATVGFVVERIETDPRCVSIARPSEACVILRSAVRLEDRAGGLTFVFPDTTIEPVHERLAAMFPGDKFGCDPIWARHLAREIERAEVELEAVLAETTVSLRALASLEVGSVLSLPVRPESPVVLRCAGVPLLEGKLGRVGERLSVRVESAFTRERER